MKNQYKGLGAFALFVFLSLMQMGVTEAKAALNDSTVPALSTEGERQQAVFSGFINGIQFEDALHRPLHEINKISEDQRKFPAMPSHLAAEGVQNAGLSLISPAKTSSSFLSSKSLKVLYHNLRL